MVVFGGGDGLSVAFVLVVVFGLVVVGAGCFAEGGFGTEDTFSGSCLEATLFVNLSVGDTALVFVLAVGADDEGFVAGLSMVEYGEEVVGAFAAIELLGSELVALVWSGGHAWSWVEFLS